jgi:hypothetical protein
MFTGLVNATASTATTAIVRNATDSSMAQMPLSYGTYTPTLTNTTNVTTSGLDAVRYTVTGNVVHVIISGSLTPTAAITNSVLTVSLPITTTVTGPSYVGTGMMAPNGGSGFPYIGGMVQIASATTATFRFYTGSNTSSAPFVMDFTYTL